MFEDSRVHYAIFFVEIWPEKSPKDARFPTVEFPSQKVDFGRFWDVSTSEKESTEKMLPNGMVDIPGDALLSPFLDD